MAWLEVAIIMPKYDNSKNPIEPAELEKYMWDLAKKVSYVSGNKIYDAESGKELYAVGFSAYPDVYGCFVAEELIEMGGELHEGFKKDVMCDENLKLVIDIPVDGEDYDEKIKKINRAIDEVAREIAKDLGQESIMLTREFKKVDFIEGQKKLQVPEEKRRKSKFVWHRHD